MSWWYPLFTRTTPFPGNFPSWLPREQVTSHFWFFVKRQKVKHTTRPKSNSIKLVYFWRQVENRHPFPSPPAQLLIAKLYLHLYFKNTDIRHFLTCWISKSIPAFVHNTICLTHHCWPPTDGSQGLRILTSRLRIWFLGAIRCGSVVSVCVWQLGAMERWGSTFSDPVIFECKYACPNRIPFPWNRVMSSNCWCKINSFSRSEDKKRNMVASGVRFPIKPGIWYLFSVSAPKKRTNKGTKFLFFGGGEMAMSGLLECLRNRATDFNYPSTSTFVSNPAMQSGLLQSSKKGGRGRAVQWPNGLISLVTGKASIQVDLWNVWETVEFLEICHCAQDK